MVPVTRRRTANPLPVVLRSTRRSERFIRPTSRHRLAMESVVIRKHNSRELCAARIRSDGANLYRGNALYVILDFHRCGRAGALQLFHASA